MLYSTKCECSSARLRLKNALYIKGFEHFQHSFQHIVDKSPSRSTSDIREKYGDTNGSNQEKESPELVENFLKDVEIDTEMKSRINYLVSHHHTYTNVDGIDYRILLEADFLVNADESEMSEAAILTARERVFKTNTGKKLLTSIYKLPAEEA